MHPINIIFLPKGCQHENQPSSLHTVAVAQKYGIDISGQRCRQLNADDFIRFDLIVGMDQVNIAAIDRRRPEKATAETGLFYDLALGDPKQIPDPYYGTQADFERIYRMILAASNGLSTRF